MNGLPSDPGSRLAELRRRFEARHERVAALSVRGTIICVNDIANADDDLPTRGVPFYVDGRGGSAMEAVDDWFGKLPSAASAYLIWRDEPALFSERDFETKQMKWLCHSRGHIVPPLKDAA